VSGDLSRLRSSKKKKKKTKPPNIPKRRKEGGRDGREVALRLRLLPLLLLTEKKHSSSLSPFYCTGK